MSCPNCGHTMQCVGGNIFCCPRCGTVMVEQMGAAYTPALVRRCAEVGRFLPPPTAPGVIRQEWVRLIDECLPKERR
jgi:tRNA(Ile2) C34 agmatinyltransferase TiaS